MKRLQKCACDVDFDCLARLFHHKGPLRIWVLSYFYRLCGPPGWPLTPLFLNGDQMDSFKSSSTVSLRHTGLLSEKHPEEHGVHLSPGEKLHHQQGHPQPLPVLSTAEVPGSGNVQGV